MLYFCCIYQDVQPQQGVTGLPTAPTSLPSAVDTSDIVSLFLRGFPSMHLSISVIVTSKSGRRCNITSSRGAAKFWSLCRSRVFTRSTAIRDSNHNSVTFD